MCGGAHREVDPEVRGVRVQDRCTEEAMCVEERIEKWIRR